MKELACPSDEPRTSLCLRIEFDPESRDLLQQVVGLCEEVIERGDYTPEERDLIEWTLERVVSGLFSSSPKRLFKVVKHPLNLSWDIVPGDFDGV